MSSKTLLSAILLACLSLCGVQGAPPDKRQIALLKRQITEAAASDSWGEVGPLLEQLSEANDKGVWKWMVKVAERAPEGSVGNTVTSTLGSLAARMDNQRVQAEIKKSALRSRSPRVRRVLVAHLATRQEWPVLIDAIRDQDEEVAALATWKLVDAQVEDAIEPMITVMERYDRDHGHIWDVLRNGLGKLLGGKRGSGVEYRSLWTLVQERGGLSGVKPEEETGREVGESQVRLFGREIDCTRVVFILDVSGSMQAIDPNQADPRSYGGSRTRDPAGPGGSEVDAPRGLTRLERAQIALKEVIAHLPSNYRINIVAYSTRTKIWRSSDGDNQPQLHELNAKNRQSASDFVDDFQANGVTATDDALERAFDVAGARCFYLLSDGFATQDGTTRIDTAEILETIDRAGEDRHVTIHTMGFEGADRDMMQRVAEHSGGRYSDIR